MYKRIVVKVGTKVLSREDNQLDVRVMARLVEQIVALRRGGVEVVLVSSGAMGAGRGLLAPARREKPAEKQLLCAVGQVKLMSEYARLFGRRGVLTAQVLATKEDFRDRNHYLNMRRCFEQLLAGSVVPVVNENDVVATRELLFTDNDELAGLVAAQVDADAVIILTSVEGFLVDAPDGGKRVLSEVALDSVGAYQKFVSPDKTAFGRGGMLTKFNIARRLARQGIAVHLASGRRKDVLLDIFAAKRVGTRFAPARKPSALKRRLANSDGLSKGAVRLNRGAQELLCSRQRIMSLLPVGLEEVEGDFCRGDVIEIEGANGQRIGYGIAQYGAERARELMGVKRARALIHYDHMFIEM